jgi:hypothetical protein
VQISRHSKKGVAVREEIAMKAAMKATMFGFEFGSEKR